MAALTGGEVKGIWIDEGDRPDYALLRRYGLDTVMMSARSDREGVTAATFDEIRRQGFAAGIYVGHGWDEADGLQPEQSAERMNAQWLKFGGLKKRLSVMFNDEGKNVDAVLRKITRWRQLREFAPTLYSPEGFQGGILRQIASHLTSYRVMTVPQNYGGGMTAAEQWDSRGTVYDLLLNGFASDLVIPFLDGRYLKRGWELGGAVVFTQGRLERT